jgi:hypothetical protein
MCKEGCCKKGCMGKKISKVLVIVGGLNWGLVGIGMMINKSWNLVNMIFGSMPTLEAIIYILVGASAVMLILCCKCKKCIVGKCGGGYCGSMPAEPKM